MHPWKLSALAAATLVLTLGVAPPEAHALSLGRLSVQSALGEPLRAEIELPQITPEEAQTLRATPASAEVFRLHGLEYSSAVHDIRIKLERRPNGSAVLRLSSNRPVTDPFVDLVLDTSSSSGHMVRNYTLLLDPPSIQKPPVQVTVAPQISVPLATSAPTPATNPTPTAAAPMRPAATPAVKRASAPAATPAPTPSGQTQSQGSQTIKVRSGATAGSIAGAQRTAEVSLDQMLVAMLRANPHAFIQGNVNRLRAGAVLHMPSTTDAQATSAPEARQIVLAQSQDFNAYRRRLAGTAPHTKQAAADRGSSGKIQTQVDDAKPIEVKPDKLKLTKADLKGKETQKEEQLAQAKQADQNASRMAELSKNLEQLNQLKQATPAPDAAPKLDSGLSLNLPTPEQAAAAPAAPEPTAQAAANAPAEPPAATETEPVSNAETPAEPTTEPPAETPTEAPAAAPPPPVPEPAPAPPPPPESSWLDYLTSNPLVSGGALAALLALLGLGGWRVLQSRRKTADVDSSFMESRLTEASFKPSGQPRSGNSKISGDSMSMSFSPSQLDVGGEVDPVAEADVYLAYGRDEEAEKILKDALRHHPERIAISVKLAEIHAKRQDRRALESVANSIYALTNGQGEQWDHVCVQGLAIDPENPLYHPGGQPAAPAVPEDNALADFPSTMNLPAAQAAWAPGTPAAAPAPALPDLDLDLDLDLGLNPNAPQAPAAPPPAPSAFAAAAAAAAQPEASLPAVEISLPEPAPAPQTPMLPDDLAPEPVDFGLTAPVDLDFTTSDPMALAPSGSAPLSAEPIPTDQALEFDLGGLSLDLSTNNAPLTPNTPVPAPAVGNRNNAAPPDDPLVTKLDLAEEFQQIGDSEGARSLMEEVLAEATGDLKVRAQRMLDLLG